jgi:parallel beta-helix repeat protein
MCRFTVLVLVTVLGSAVASAARAGNYFVAPTGSNANAGTAAAPWLTLQYAANRVNPGDTVNVLPGNYVGFDLRRSGTPASRISFLAQPGATINAPNTVTGKDGINVENASYVTVQGFTLLGTPDPAVTRAGIRVVGDGFEQPNAFSKGVIVRNNRADQWGYWGIFTGFTDDILIEGNQTSRSAREHGIYFSNSADRPTIRGNRVWGNAANGIHMNGDIDTGDTSLPGVDGVITGALVERNVIYGNGAGSAFSPGGGSGINADGLQNSTIRNNLLYDNHSTGIALYRIDGGGPSTGNTVASNTVVNAADARYTLLLNAGAAGNTVFNNILYNLNPSSARGSISITSDAVTGFKSDYNFLDPRFEINEVGGKTLAQWRAATGGDAHSTALNLAALQALFKDYANDNFALARTSTARDAGAASLNGISAPADDLLANPRPMGNGYDAGAFEYRLLPADANDDGRVDTADFKIVLDNYNKPGDFRHGDFNHDGLVSFADYQILERAFLTTLPPDPAAAAVPEPDTLALIGSLACLSVRRRRPTRLNHPPLPSDIPIGSEVRPTMKPADQDTLRDAIARNAGAVVSLPSAGMLRHCKTRLLAGEEEGFWIEAPAEEQALVDELMAKGAAIGISLKAASSKIVFTTVIRQFRAAMHINKETTVDALLLVWPTQLKAIQRRNDYRVTLPRDAEVSVRAWRITEQHYLRERPPASTQLDVSMRDLSVGGMGLICVLNEDCPKIAQDQRLRIVIGYANGELILEGRVKHLRDLPNGDVRLGIEFKKLADDFEGRQMLAMLTQIVGQLQRDEIRRRRLTTPRSAG